MNKTEAIQWATMKLREAGATTDGGCTMSPNFNFKDCCLRHDVMINYNQGITDREANRYLRECIKDKGHPILSWVYWVAVSASSKLGGMLNVVAILVAAGIGIGIYLS